MNHKNNRRVETNNSSDEDMNPTESHRFCTPEATLESFCRIFLNSRLMNGKNDSNNGSVIGDEREDMNVINGSVPNNEAMNMNGINGSIDNNESIDWNKIRGPVEQLFRTFSPLVNYDNSWVNRSGSNSKTAEEFLNGSGIGATIGRNRSGSDPMTGLSGTGSGPTTDRKGSGSDGTPGLNPFYDINTSAVKRPILKTTTNIDERDRNERSYHWNDNSYNDNAFNNRYNASLIHTTAPTGGNSWGEGNDWYSTYVRQTQRYGKTIEKHVRFANDSDASDSDHDIKDTEVANNRLNSETNYDSSGVDRIPRVKSNTSIVDSILRNVRTEEEYRRSQWNSNADQLKTNLMNNNVFFNNDDSIWNNQSWDPMRENQTTDRIEQIQASLRRNSAKEKANYTWSGQLPRRVRTKNPIYSCKVFLGGIPYDLTDSDLHCTFAQFGHITIQWPGKDIKSAIDGAAANKAGYVYIIFETYDNVSALLNSCTISYRDIDSGCRWFYNISSRRQKGKEVQVIPFDIGDRFYMKAQFSGQMEHSRTVFVGALHGMLSADGLAKVMEDLFSGVVFAGLDTDKHKYPLGSGRVSFDNQDSYLKAVLANFVEIKSSKFKKKIQIDPYIENESICAVCRVTQTAPIFCRDCFIYYCPQCWEHNHSEGDFRNHRPIVKNRPSNP